jgi:Ca2+-binding EF-hand superfamily protein
VEKSVSRHRTGEEPEHVERVDGYCEAGNFGDPICDLSKQVDDVNSEIESVMAHMKAMFARKHEGEDDDEDDDDDAESTEDSTPQADREELTAEAVEAERGEVLRHAGQATNKGTWRQVRMDLPERVPDQDTAFATADTDGDGLVSKEEFAEQIRTVLGFSNGAEMFEALGKEQPMTKAEYHAAFGDYTPEEVKEKVLAKHGNVDRAWHRSAKSKMSLKEFDAQAAEVGVPKWNAAHVFEELDMNDDSSLSANEYFPAFGASLADMGKKVKEHFGQPQDAFKKADADGNGKITLEEFKTMAAELDIQPVNAEVLWGLMAGDGVAEINQDAFLAAIGEEAMSVEEFKKLMLEKYHSADEAWEKLGLATEETLDRGKFSTWCYVMLAVSNCDQQYSSLFGSDTHTVSHKEFSKAFGQEVTFAKFKVAAMKKYTSGELAWSALDADSDGSINLDEFLAGAEELGFSKFYAEDLYYELVAGGGAGITKKSFLQAMGARSEVEIIANAPKEVRKTSKTIDELSAKIDKVEESLDKLKKSGKMDDALEAEMDAELKGMRAFEKVAGELLGAEIDSNSEKAKALYGELQTAYETREEKKTVIADLVPHGDKWWRFGFEYVFIQTLLLSFVVAATACYAMAIDFVRQRTLRCERLDERWFAEAAYTVACVAFGAATVVILMRCCETWAPSSTIIKWVPALLYTMPNPYIRHLPATRLQYEDVLIDVSMYLGCAMVVFYFLNWMTLRACETKKAQWVELEDEHFSTREESSNVSPTMFDTNVGTFLKVRAYLVSFLVDEQERPLTKKVNALFGRTLTEDALEANLRLSWYFRVHVDQSLLFLICCPWTTWLSLLAWYMLLTFLAAVLMVTYIHVMCIVATVSGVILLAMYRASRRRSRLIVDLQSATDVSKAGDLSPKLHRKTTQQVHESFSSWQVSTQTVMEGLRCSTLILIYGAAQFIGSAFCWKYYFYYNLVFCVGVLIFILLWCFEMVYIIPVFAAANSLPPIQPGDERLLQRHAEAVVSAFQDAGERQFWEDKVQHGRISIGPSGILGHQLQTSPSASQVTSLNPAKSEGGA